jgi:hypothetical protein
MSRKRKLCKKEKTPDKEEIKEEEKISLGLAILN